jgi:hypothetical protein
MNDLKKMVADLLRQVDASVCLFLKAETDRFPSAAKLLANYERARSAWVNGLVTHTRGITEVVNELCVAKHFLETNEGVCAYVEYEPRIADTDQSIDFLVKTIEGASIYFDVKTVHPLERDAWERYQRARERGYFTENAQLILDSDFMGGEIAHDFFASRERFLEYTIEFENKINLVPDRNQFFFRMVFCGDGFRWRKDQLEDFADFYFNRRHCRDDPFGDMEAHYIRERGISLAYNINDFCYFERKQRRVTPTKFVCGVRGPAVFS